MHNGPKSVAIAARNLIEAGWTRRASARDANDQRCDWFDPNARKFCVIGAILRAAYDLGESEATAHIVLVALFRHTAGFMVWNDVPDRTKEEVVAVLRKVIADFEQASMALELVHAWATAP